MAGDRIVTVRHPGPVLLRRKRKRIHEDWFVAMDTPVVLRAGSPEDLGETHAFKVGDRDLTWRVFEGTLWYQVDGRSCRRGTPSPSGRFGVAEFEAFLAGGRSDRVSDCTDLGLVTCRTPLAAVGANAPGPTNGAVIGLYDRPPSEIEVSEIFEDGRASATDGLRRFMDERVRFVGDVVLIRAYDPLVTLGKAGWTLQPFPQARLTSYRLKHREPLGYRPDVYDHGAAWQEGVRWQRRSAGTDPWVGSLAGAPYGTDTARLVAGYAVTAATCAFIEMRDVYTYFLTDRRNAEPARIAACLSSEAWDLTVRASLGSLDENMSFEAVDVARRLISAVADCYGRSAEATPMVQEARFLCRRFEEFEAALVRDAAPDADDLAALGSLVHRT